MLSFDISSLERLEQLRKEQKGQSPKGDELEYLYLELPKSNEFSEEPIPEEWQELTVLCYTGL